jgi:hypothetical protein
MRASLRGCSRLILWARGRRRWAREVRALEAAVGGLLLERVGRERTSRKWRVFRGPEGERMMQALEVEMVVAAPSRTVEEEEKEEEEAQ